MKDVITDFTQRVKEIDTYFDFLEKLLTYDTVNWSNKESSLEKISIDLRGIMKANIFIMLYNLTESSISAGIEAIHTHIKRSKTPFDTIQKGIKKEIVQYLKKNKSADRFLEEINEISFDIISSCFDKKELFSGNVDGKEIRELATKYGFSPRTKCSGEKLKEIKDNRNHLAHGDFSFREKGKDYTLSDIREYKEEAINYLRNILINIETYIKNKHYIA